MVLEQLLKHASWWWNQRLCCVLTKECIWKKKSIHKPVWVSKHMKCSFSGEVYKKASMTKQPQIIRNPKTIRSLLDQSMPAYKDKLAFPIYCSYSKREFFLYYSVDFLLIKSLSCFIRICKQYSIPSSIPPVSETNFGTVELSCWEVNWPDQSLSNQYYTFSCIYRCITYLTKKPLKPVV